VNYLDNDPSVELDKRFYYGTLAYRLTEKLLCYGGYWDTEQQLTELAIVNGTTQIVTGEVDLDIWTLGVAYQLLDVLTLKAQTGIIDTDIFLEFDTYNESDNFSHWSLAVSVMF
jgi:hypothetical protein